MDTKKLGDRMPGHIQVQNQKSMNIVTTLKARNFERYKKRNWY